MKSTPHFVTVKGRQVRVKLAQGGWFTVKSIWSPVRPVKTAYTSYTLFKRGGYVTYRARTLWQLQRQINGLSTGAHP